MVIKRLGERGGGCWCGGGPVLSAVGVKAVPFRSSS
jgi:hypothetical protein